MIRGDPGEEIGGLKIFCRPDRSSPTSCKEPGWTRSLICLGENRVPEELLRKLAEMELSRRIFGSELIMSAAPSGNRAGGGHHGAHGEYPDRIARTDSGEAGSGHPRRPCRSLFYRGLTVTVGPLIYFADHRVDLFRQKRVGKNGRIFKIWKFRSMYRDAEARRRNSWTRSRDGRPYVQDGGGSPHHRQQSPNGIRGTGSAGSSGRHRLTSSPRVSERARQRYEPCQHRDRLRSMSGGITIPPPGVAIKRDLPGSGR